MKIRGVEFDVDAEWDRDGRLDCLWVFLDGDKGGQELSDVLSEKVLQEIEQELYRRYEGPEVNEDDPEVDR
jgi:hypothetical protein